MLKDYFSLLNVSVYVKLVFVMLLCATVICGCGMGDASQRSIDARSAPAEDLPNIPAIPPSGVDFNNTELGKRIRQDYLNNQRNQDPDAYRHYTINDVWINGYYGIYNDCAAVMMDVGSTGLMYKIVISGILFEYNSGNRIIVWSKGQFYTLQDAYHLNILTIKDILNIANLRNVVPDYFEENNVGISKKTEEQFKQDYLTFLRRNHKLDNLPAIEDIWVEKYYGTYKEYAMVTMGDNCCYYADNEIMPLIWDNGTFFDSPEGWDIIDFFK